MRRDILVHAVRAYLRKRPTTVIQVNATHDDRLTWEDARVFWFANFPANAEKTAGYGTWREDRKGV